jgi:hypothetical protein
LIHDHLRGQLVDPNEASIKISSTTKTDIPATPGKVNRASAWVGRVLDEAAPACAPFAARWDAEADRRRQLRTPEHLKALIAAQREHNSARSIERQASAARKVARRESKNPVGGVRRAARAADKAARSHRQAAKGDLVAARKSYPDTLTRVAVKAHAAHAIPAGVASYVLSTEQDWTTWPGVVSVGLISLNAVALWLGRRGVSVHVEDGLSAEEQRLAERLDPSWWVEHAPSRGLAGTVTTPAQVTDKGLVSHVRLDGMTPAAFKAKADEIRALLGVRTDLRMDITAGTHGDRARILLRTRSVQVPESLIWTPESVGVGIDMETGDPVVIPIEGTHKGVAAATNMGKSTFWRPWMMEAVRNPLMAGVLLDPKRLEARTWKGKIRTEGHQRDGDIRQYIYDGVCELEREMRHRQSIAEVTQWVPSTAYPILLVVIEEMANIVRMAKEKAWKDILDKLDGLFSEARASGIWFVWATQFPSRSGGGITPQIAENTLTMVALTTEGSTADQVIYGNDGPGKGWKPSELGGIPGRALIKHKKRPPNPVQAWYVTDDTIKALPDVKVWHSKAEAPAEAGEKPKLRLVKDATPAEAGAEQADEAPAELSNRDRVLQAVREGARTARDVIDRTGMHKGTAYREIKALTASGGLVKGEDGMLRIGEASA